MEEGIRGDLHVINTDRALRLNNNGNYRPSLSSSGRSTPRGSSLFRRSNSSRTPRRGEGRGASGGSRWFRSSHIVYWLLLITLWAYLGFYVQSRWAHDDNNEDPFANEISDPTKNQRRDLIANQKLVEVVTNVVNKTDTLASKSLEVILAKKTDAATSPPKKLSYNKKLSVKKKSKKGQRGKTKAKPKGNAGAEADEMDEQEQDLPMQNSTYGMLVGPFGSIENEILEWSPEKRTGTCERKGEFARLVWSRKFVLVFHELSLTGAPLSMLELATELMSCGATVSVIALSKKGGLRAELLRRKITLIEDKAALSIKMAKKADLIIAGSAVCSSWIEQYMDQFTTGSSQVAWWIMENRREYFNRTKGILDSVRMLIFISESQSKQWQSWCEEEKIKLYSPPSVIPLSVNEELAFVAGLASTLNTPYFSTDKMLEKKDLLRDAVRKEMGVASTDTLAITLSSINPGKGQSLLLESANLVIKQNLSFKTSKNRRTLRRKSKPGLQLGFKLLIGSVGSKSNKITYVKELLGFLSQHSNLSKSVIWTPASTRVAGLYSAADVYVINSQGMGETFGRVTIEAMAFGLPVLGTDGGGTTEIVERNVTGLIHPVGRPGTEVLARNLEFLLQNPSARKQMGMKGREKVEKMFLKRHMFNNFAKVLFNCMRIKT